MSKVTEVQNEVKTSIVNTKSFSEKQKLYITRFVTTAKRDIFTRAELRAHAQSSAMKELKHDYAPAFLVKNHALHVFSKNEQIRGIYRIPAIELKLIADKALVSTLQTYRNEFMKSRISALKSRAIASAAQSVSDEVTTATEEETAKVPAKRKAKKRAAKKIAAASEAQHVVFDALAETTCNDATKIAAMNEVVDAIDDALASMSDDEKSVETNENN